MDPVCHPVVTGRSETDLLAEQDEFMLTGAASCVKMQRLAANDRPPSVKGPVAVLHDVVERATTRPPQPPTFRPSPRPTIVTPEATASQSTGSVHSDDAATRQRDEISAENARRLTAMSPSEIRALQEEMRECIPADILAKLAARSK